MLDSNIQKRFEDALSSDSLRELAIQFVAEGRSQVEVYHLFEAFHEFVDDAKRDADEAILYSSLECVVGYCSPGSKWFDHYLSNDEIFSFESGIAKDDITRMSDIIHKVSRSWIPRGYEKLSDKVVTCRVSVMDRGAFVREIRVTFEKDGADWRLRADELA